MRSITLTSRTPVSFTTAVNVIIQCPFEKGRGELLINDTGDDADGWIRLSYRDVIALKGAIFISHTEDNCKEVLVAIMEEQ